jgi:AcrR family transcriptional regulator
MARVGPKAKTDARRRLLQAAAGHFARHGYEAANVNAIALEAGFAKGTIYNYFPSKRELFAEVLSEACRRAVERYATLEHGTSTRESLEALVRADVAVVREEEAFMKVLVREAMSFRSETYALILERHAPFLAVICEILERGMERGEIRPKDPPARLAVTFLGLLSLLYVQHWGSAGVWPALDEIPELVVGMFLDGAGAEKGRRS